MFRLDVLVSAAIAAAFGALCGLMLIFVFLGRMDNLDAERDEAEERADSMKRLLDAVSAHTEDGIYVTDGEMFLRINDKAMEYLRLAEEDTLSEMYDDAVRGVSPMLTYKELLAGVTEGKGEVEIEYGRSAYRVRYTALEEQDGGFSATDRIPVLVMVTDITATLNAEDIQIDFVANVSHELKTPLTTVKAYSETLLEGGQNDPEMTRDFLEIIVSEADRMDRLVKDLLLLTRIESDSGESVKADNDMVTLVKTAIKKMSIAANNKDITINKFFDEKRAAMVLMNRDRMEQVLLNIISNAIKYTNEKGRIDIDVVLSHESVKVMVSDNGVGIPEKALSRVFERFFRVDKARSRNMGGSGLGLAISKQIIDEHEGEIEIDSKYGRGTTVTITLPAASPSRGMRGIE
jgi:two-component system sensor histidine kinase VicK